MKRLGIVLGAIVLVAAGAALAYGATRVSTPGITLTGCLQRDGDLQDLAVGTSPRRKCGKRETEVSVGNGDITAVSAGTGIQGGAESGEATVAIAPSFRLPQSCASGQTLTISGTGWSCADRQTLTTQQIPAGDSRCANGGVAILIGLLQPALVCNGAPGASGANGKDGSGLAKSPNGQFTMTVSNQGIVLSGPRGKVVVDYSGAHVNTIGGATP
jgi:hypothetical protein